MGTSPGLYCDIGKKARDVLYKDFARRPEMYGTRYKDGAWSFDLSFKLQDFVPGLSSVVGLTVPHSGKVELQYVQNYFGVSGGIGVKAGPIMGLNLSPMLNFSGVFGNNFFAFGSVLVFDVASREFDKLHAGLSYNTDLFITSLTIDKLEAVKATCHYTVNAPTRTALAAELRYGLMDNRVSLSVGAKHALFPMTVLKGKLDTKGTFSALIQQGLWQKLFVTVGGEVHFMGQTKPPNFGLSIALRF